MNPSSFSLIVDAGNTRIKCALYKGAELHELKSFSKAELQEVKNYLQQYQSFPAIIASVLSDKETKWLKQLHSNAILFNSSLPLPLKMGYETPETLGADRLCNAIAAYDKCRSAVLAIDLGTCIKYDFTDETGTYLGGAISPGLSMRFKAMNTFTGKLPLIDDVSKAELTGKNTADAMRSGVLNGIQAEIEGFIHQYRNLFGALPVIITGGDSQYFDFGQINGIFADENLTLKGLQLTLANYGS